jgi:hypothetical protein
VWLLVGGEASVAAMPIADVTASTVIEALFKSGL